MQGYQLPEILFEEKKSNVSYSFLLVVSLALSILVFPAALLHKVITKSLYCIPYSLQTYGS